MANPLELEEVLDSSRTVALGILDGESDFDTSLEYYSLLNDGARAIPALMVVSPRTLETLTGAAQKATINDEYFTRPYSADALRWRVEAMLIRSQTVDDGSGPVIESGRGIDSGAFTKRATVVGVFNPKGGVGKTTISINLAAALQVRRGQRVLLIDADTVTGHIANSLGLDQIQTVVDAWADDREEGGAPRTIAELATHHPNGLQVAALTSSPLDTDGLDPAEVGDALDYSRRGFDFIIVDMHPSYGPVNKVIFDRADRILVPITPDVPALRAAVQLYGLADELGIQDKLAMVVNRANSGVSVADMERDRGDAGDGPHPVRWSPLRPGGERGADRGRAVPQGEGHRGLRGPGRSAPGHRADAPNRRSPPAGRASGSSGGRARPAGSERPDRA